jgi:hypothetical protein
MRVRIVRPLPKELDGIPVGHLAFQGCYEIAAPLCDLLLVSGYAVPESDLEPIDDRRTVQRRAPRRTLKRVG